jgi:hypothetical protein
LICAFVGGGNLDGKAGEAAGVGCGVAAAIGFSMF